GGDASGTGATAIGKCIVKNLPKGLPKGTTVVVNFTYGENGRLTVSATLPDLENAGATMTIHRASGLSDEQVQYWQERIAAGLKLEPKAPAVETKEAVETEERVEPEDATVEEPEIGRAHV